MKRVICDYCHRNAQLVTGATIYPHRPDLFHRWFWHCEPCDAWVGTHRTSAERAPMGRLANAELRKIRQRVHAQFDPMWQSGRMTRSEAYQWLAGAMRISTDNCHVGMFNVEQCQTALAILADRRKAA